jgi:transcriptional regulator with XRE-family HTH domain
MLTDVDATVATLIRTARTTNGLSVRALATRAGVAASTVSRVESGTIDPTFQMVQLLIAAADQQLVVSVEPLGDKSKGTLAELSDAWHRGPYGDEPDWTRLRSFIDRVALQPQKVREAIQLRPSRSASPMMDSLLAGIAEKLAADASIKEPKWTHRVPGLDEEWAAPATPRLRARWRANAPKQLLDRGILIDAASLWRADDSVHA